MNRRDALKSLAAVAAGGSLPAAGAVELPIPIDQYDPAAALTFDDIVGFLKEFHFDPAIWVCIRKIEESLP